MALRVCNMSQKHPQSSQHVEKKDFSCIGGELVASH